MLLQIFLHFVCFPMAVLVGFCLSRIYDRFSHLSYDAISGKMKTFISYGGILLFVSPVVWSFLEPDKARPILMPLFCGSFFAFIACFCLIALYRGSVNLLESIKEPKEQNDFSVKPWQSFIINIYLAVVLIVVFEVAWGSLIMLRWQVEALFQ